MKIKTTVLQEDHPQICTDARFSDIENFHPGQKIILLTDENVFALHKEKFKSFTVITIKSGEANKTQSAIDEVISQMLELNIDKSWLLAGVGGGVVTDIAGYAASIYKRGIKCGLVPTTILGMTDAAIGGKNGVNVGIYKNMVGTTYRPQFILYDYSFLDTLSKEEHINGFAEIIKHACIKDAVLFEELKKHTVEYFLQNRQALSSLIEKNIDIKSAVVANDEFETWERYLLNFGHTFGHAIENIYGLPHGHAISIGMVIAAKISELTNDLPAGNAKRIEGLLAQYGLPVSLKIDAKLLMNALQKDKKRAGDDMNFVLLSKIGNGIVKRIPIHGLNDFLLQIV